MRAFIARLSSAREDGGLSQLVLLEGSSDADGLRALSDAVDNCRAVLDEHPAKQKSEF